MISLPIARTLHDLRSRITDWKRDGEEIHLVPTMGALHAGHARLVRCAVERGGRAVVSIFVNPSQFGPGEDYTAYPRREAEDVATLQEAGASLVWTPGVDEMYPPGFATKITIGALTGKLEGSHRPGHFDGVAQVVTKLLMQVTPDAAYFGEKDYQQLLVIRKLVTDLDIPVEIVPVPTVREADGLAMSSRNAYLTAAEREVAPALARILGQTADAARKRRIGPFDDLLANAVEELRSAGFGPVDYVALCDARTLDPAMSLDVPARILGAARLGRARLIDNLPVTATE